MSSIFIPIASLMDKELAATVENIYSAAANPDDIYVGIHLTGWPKKEIKALQNRLAAVSRNIRYTTTKLPKNLDKRLKTLGVGRGRTGANNLYSGQEYVLQIDAHTMLDTHWDSKLIELHAEASEEAKSEKTILTAYCGEYAYEKGHRRFSKDDDGLFQYPKFVPDSFFKVDAIPVWDLALATEINREEKFIPAIKFNANFAFGKSDWLTGNYLDPEALFYDEELTQTINLLRAGYCLVFPNLKTPLIAHLYHKDLTEESTRTQIYTEITPAGYKKSTEMERSTFFKVLDAPENSATIKKYQKWARLNLRLGSPSHSLYIPKTFLMED